VSPSDSEPLSIEVDGSTRVPGLLLRAPRAHAIFVIAHGAGAGMRHAFLTDVACGLAQRGLDTLRYEFPYMSRGSRRPDSPPLCHATVRAAVEAARRLAPTLPILAGGKSFGGRMTSQAQASHPLPGVRGLVFLGFPLHPPKEPSAARAAHLARVEVPMLFLQGSRDEFATQAHLMPLIETLGARARLELFSDADHSFHVPMRSGRSDAQVMDEMLDAIAQFSGALAQDSGTADRESGA
jgi:predicted alpha/beta-hydrolase family hydrolase